jgi:hypothetical protein
VLLMQTRHQIAHAWSEFFAQFPIIVGPTWCEPQFAHGYDIAGPTSAADIVNLMRFVTPMSLLGLPVVCVPTGVAAGLPHRRAGGRRSLQGRSVPRCRGRDRTAPRHTHTHRRLA